MIQREYEEFKVRINGLVAKAQKIPDEGWIMQDGTPWPGNNTRDHPGMIQVSAFFCCLSKLWVLEHNELFLKNKLEDFDVDAFKHYLLCAKLSENIS